MKKVFLLGATSVLLASTAQSQEVDDDSAIGKVLDVVTVTATKKANPEDVQNVPLSVTGFNKETLNALKVRDLQSLSFSAPNVSLDEIGTQRGVANFSIRGLGINSSIPSIDPTVGVFVDGVYYGITSGVVFDLFDLESVEVARGPQGVLFGRNTTGGAVIVNTGNPTGEFMAKARASIEGPIDDDRGGASSIVQGAISGPIFQDVLHGKIGAYYNTDDGYFQNGFNGDNQGEAQTTIVRSGLEWFAAPNLTFLAKAEYFSSEGDGPAVQNRGFFERDMFDFSNDFAGEYENEALTASLRTDWQVSFGDGTITNIIGYRKYESDALSDVDGIPAPLFLLGADIDQEQISNELRYAGSFGKAQVTTGLFYFDQTVAYDETRQVPPATPLTFSGGGRQDHTVFGVFGQVDYTFSESLTGTLGLRYSSEEKDADLTFIVPRTEICSVIGDTCTDDVSDQNDWSNFTPKVGLQYFLTERSQIYGSYTRGFRSGGYNFRITDPTAFLAQVANTDEVSFDEETVDAFEIGTKNEFNNGRLQLNGALFWNEIDDMQREVNIASASAATSQFILNTASARVRGLEFEGRWVLSDSLLLSGNVGLLDAEYDEINFDISGDGVVNELDAALELPRSPKATYGVGVLYERSLGTAGDMTMQVRFQHRDRAAYTENNFGWTNATDMLDAYLSWQTPMDGVELTLYGKNLLDEVSTGADTQIPFGGPLSTGTPQTFASRPAAGTASLLKAGRRVGVELTVDF